MEAIVDAGLGGGFLKVAEVARLLRVSKTTVMRLIREGRLPAVRFGRVYRIEARDLVDFVQSGRT